MRKLDVEFIKNDLPKSCDAIEFIERCLCDANMSRPMLARALCKHRQELNMIFIYRVRITIEMFTKFCVAIQIESLLLDENYVKMLIENAHKKYRGKEYVRT